MIMAPTIACVVETWILSRVASRIQVAAPTSAASMNEDPGVVWRKLWGAKAESSLIEMIMAERLPRPVNRPPQTRGEYRGRKVDVSGSVMRATMLFPTSLAPLPKARTNNTTSPRSAVTDISGPHTPLFRRNTFHDYWLPEALGRYLQSDTIARGTRSRTFAQLI